MRKIKKQIVALSVSLVSLISGTSVSNASVSITINNDYGTNSPSGTSIFTDVSSNYWFYDSVLWGYQNQIVSGFPDGSFKPTKEVTQSEFITMLLKAYKLSFEKSKGESWDASYLKYARSNEWSLVSNTNEPIDRGQVATLIANAAGKNFDEFDAIHFLIDEGFSNGKSDKSITGYKRHDLLSRAEAIAFIKGVTSKLDKLNPAPITQESYENPNSTIKSVKEDKTVWKPTILKQYHFDQSAYAKKIFSDFTWDYNTRTLKFKFGQFPDLYPTAAIAITTKSGHLTHDLDISKLKSDKKVEKISFGKTYEFKNLPEEFKIDVTLFTDQTMTESPDSYTIYSYEYAERFRNPEGVPFNSLLVTDQFGRNASLEAIKKGLGL
jgi:S-layer homology domain.